MILLFLIMRCTPTIRKLIEATPLSLSSPSATSLSALAPAQRAGAQRLCALARTGPVGAPNDVRCSGQTGSGWPRLRTTRLPSRPREFHPEPLTDPDLILSHHPARAID